MKYCILAGLGLLTAAATAAHAASDFSGRWYTEGVENGLHAQFILDNRRDGTFTKTVRDATDCKNIQTWTESGRWTIAKGQYLEVTETVRGKPIESQDGDTDDVFKLTIRDGTDATLLDWKTQITWQFARVGYDFEMPPPRGCTI